MTFTDMPYQELTCEVGLVCSLVLRDGSVFQGRSFGVQLPADGEVGLPVEPVNVMGGRGKVGANVPQFVAGGDVTSEEAVDRASVSYEKRAELATNQVARQLFEIIALKKAISAFLGLQIKQLSNIGNTVFAVFEWIVQNWGRDRLCHCPFFAREGILKALNGSTNGVSRGVFLLAEVSREGNLITPDYIKATVERAAKFPDLITGFVCQNKDIFNDPGLIQLTPGVQLKTSGDGHGQIYNTPEKVVLDKGADIAVVGRGYAELKCGGVPAMKTHTDCMTSRNIVKYPGFIDVHGHVRVPEATYKEDCVLHRSCASWWNHEHLLCYAKH
ncbi:hypothetical protein MSG28_014553 [Choristoneura fumiferana]|uniref:Uncharacterized protein n=1 Tax=Choristoneura fumiferana TaxID=7141 RepID=A0ACC0JRS9_CHOFU|nr:hypothetical protein MSG28_014553 [Choristoneura fumiferana]